MARNRSRGTLVDYLVAAIAPGLIMIMVSSLMFFLLDIAFDEALLDRLHWVLFWFVFGIVLITRISMQMGTEMAKGYGALLGGAVALVATVLAGFQPFLLVVMGIVWWATHNLTFDCTLLEEDQDSGVGLLQETGLDTSRWNDSGDMGADSASPAPTDDPEAMDTTLLPDRPWWKFWGRDSELARRPHAPGAWLIYFTIASLPVFGLGQRLVPGIHEDRRAWLFVYFLAYIASAMGLLLATSFLNLRRYLRRRKVKMPAAMTATWLSTGAIMIIGLTLAAALLPLPLAKLSSARESSRDLSHLSASKYAVLKDSGVQGKGARSEGPAASKTTGKAQNSGKAEGSGKTNDPNAAQQTNGKGREGGRGGQGQSKSGAPKGKPSASPNGQEGKKGAAQDQSGDQAKGQKQSGQDAKSQDQAKGQDGRSKDQADGKDPAEKGDQKDSQSDGEKSQEEKQDEGDSSSQSPQPPSFGLPHLDWLQTPIMVVGIAILIYGLIRYYRDLIQVLLALLKAILGVFGFSWSSEQPKAQAEAAAAQEPPPRPFSSYPNPFDAGMDQQLTPDDLIIYSFEALEAWAYEKEVARSLHETPTEFVARIGERQPELGPDAARMVSYFVAIIYGRRGFGPEVLPQLRQFWLALEQAAWSAPAEAAMGV
jgi:Domain of unknown function (DUF4129)